MKNKTKKELAELVNKTLEERDIVGHLAALGNLDSNFQVTVLNPQTIEIKICQIPKRKNLLLQACRI